MIEAQMPVPLDLTEAALAVVREAWSKHGLPGEPEELVVVPEDYQLAKTLVRDTALQAFWESDLTGSHWYVANKNARFWGDGGPREAGLPEKGTLVGPGSLEPSLAATEPVFVNLPGLPEPLEVRLAISSPEGRFVAVQLGEGGPVAVRRTAEAHGRETGAASLAGSGEWLSPRMAERLGPILTWRPA